MAAPKRDLQRMMNGVGTPNRDLRSPDPGDHIANPPAEAVEPMDQSNANAENRLGTGEPPRGAMDVGGLRKRMGLTQRQFAGIFGFPVATLRHWERGNRKPGGTAWVLLHVIRDNPRAVLRAVHKARRREAESVAATEPCKSDRASPGYGERPPPLWKLRRRP
jgi:DNA-binding transcriptional regulator YiaG